MLTIDDKILKTIVQDLYYPKLPYEFSVLGVEIQVTVYEQFLGNAIRLTAGHQAKENEWYLTTAEKKRILLVYCCEQVDACELWQTAQAVA